MGRRRPKVPEYKVHSLPPESIGAFRTLDDAVYSQKKEYGDRPMACRKDIPPPIGWSRVRYYADKMFFVRRESL